MVEVDRTKYQGGVSYQASLQEPPQQRTAAATGAKRHESGKEHAGIISRYRILIPRALRHVSDEKPSGRSATIRGQDATRQRPSITVRSRS